MRVFNRCKFITGIEIDDFIAQIDAGLVDTQHELSVTVDYRKIELSNNKTT